MDEQLIKVLSEGIILETFPFDREGLESGHFESLIDYNGKIYHILLSPDQVPLKINHIASSADYSDQEDGDFTDWDGLIADGLEEYPYEDTPFWDEDDSEEYDENEVNGC